MGFDISGVTEWFISQAQGIFTIGFILMIAISIFKRSIGALITTIILGAVIAMFIFFPDTIEKVGSGLSSLLGE